MDGHLSNQKLDFKWVCLVQQVQQFTFQKNDRCECRIEAVTISLIIRPICAQETM